jgi:hypothetical protein
MKNPKRYIALLFLVVGCLAAFYGVALADSVDERVLRLNETIAAEGLPWQAGRTSVSGLSPDERKALLGGPSEPLPVAFPTLDVSEEGGSSPVPYSGGAPPVASFDWRNRDGHNWMTPVTQQCCGDCWAHATCGSMEVRLRWQKGGTYGYELPINLAERYAVTCSPHGTCSPWNIPSLLNFIQSDGVADEDCLPYNCTSSCSDRCSNWAHRVYKVTSHGTYNGGSTFEDNVTSSCYNYGPVPVWMMVYSDFWDYSGGIYVKSSSATEEDGHFVVIVGWGTSGTTPYWICKNSWGTGWGVNGYFYIRRGTNESRIEEQAYWLTPQNLPNLDDSTPTGWDYPIVPRGDNTATATSAHVPATLPGDSNSTYWNIVWTNEGTVEARDNVAHMTTDGIYTWWCSIPYQPAGYDVKYNNYGPHTIKGGRHTLCFDELDYDNRVWEYDERDNWYCRQFIWSPYALNNNDPLTHTTPPKKDSLGYSYYNCDGFSFQVQHNGSLDWWSAVGVLPSNTSADYDVLLHDIGTYTGSQGGFAGYLQWSGYGGSVSEFVIVNENNDSSGTYYAGAINWNEGSGNFRIEEDTSDVLNRRPGTLWNGPWNKVAENVLDIFEVYLPEGTYYFLLDQTAGTCDLGMTLYDDETVTTRKINYMSGGYSNSAGDGGDESFLITIPDAGYHGLVVWKADASDYAKSASYRLAVGPPAITVTTPNGGETLPMGSAYNITWDSFGPAATIGSYVRIQISRNGGVSWSTITSSTVNDGIYSWTATGPESTQCRIRVTSTSSGTYTDTSDANFTIADTTAPTPNPMTWATEPYAVSTSSISMVATTATDNTPPVAYYFLCVTATGHSSGWQTGTSYTDTGLPPNTWCGYRVRARDSAASPNYTDYCIGSRYAYTLAKGPVAAAFSNITTTSVRANWGANGNPAGTQYYCENTTKGTNSGWTTATNWNSTGLTCGTSYSFRVKARNGDAIQTGWVSLSSASTQPCADVCECNLNGDSSCNILDYQLFIQDWGRTNCGTPPGTGNPPNDCECDLNQDGKCNILDYQVFIQDWGRTDCP